MPQRSKVVGSAEKRKPPNAGKGREKGVPNKVTRELKDMILGALDQAGGIDYLHERAADPRTASAFLSLVGKTLPLTVKGTGANGEHIFHKIIVEVVKV
jgi:hypothetical protein